MKQGISPNSQANAETSFCSQSPHSSSYTASPKMPDGKQPTRQNPQTEFTNTSSHQMTRNGRVDASVEPIVARPMPNRANIWNQPMPRDIKNPQLGTTNPHLAYGVPMRLNDQDIILARKMPPGVHYQQAPMTSPNQQMPQGPHGLAAESSGHSFTTCTMPKGSQVKEMITQQVGNDSDVKTGLNNQILLTGLPRHVDTNGVASRSSSECLSPNIITPPPMNIHQMYRYLPQERNNAEVLRNPLIPPPNNIPSMQQHMVPQNPQPMSHVPRNPRVSPQYNIQQQMPKYLPQERSNIQILPNQKISPGTSIQEIYLGLTPQQKLGSDHQQTSAGRIDVTKAGIPQGMTNGNRLRNPDMRREVNVPQMPMMLPQGMTFEDRLLNQEMLSRVRNQQVGRGVGMRTDQLPQNERNILGQNNQQMFFNNERMQSNQLIKGSMYYLAMPASHQQRTNILQRQSGVDIGTLGQPGEMTHKIGERLKVMQSSQVADRRDVVTNISQASPQAVTESDKKAGVGKITSDGKSERSQVGSKALEDATKGSDEESETSEEDTNGLEKESEVSEAGTNGLEKGSEVSEEDTDGSEKGSEVSEEGTDGSEKGSEVSEEGTDGSEKGSEVSEEGTDGSKVSEEGTDCSEEGTDVSEEGTSGSEVSEEGTESSEVTEGSTQGTNGSEEGSEVSEECSESLEEGEEHNDATESKNDDATDEAHAQKKADVNVEGPLPKQYQAAHTTNQNKQEETLVSVENQCRKIEPKEDIKQSVKNEGKQDKNMDHTVRNNAEAAPDQTEPAHLIGAVNYKWTRPSGARGNPAENHTAVPPSTECSKDAKEIEN